MEFGGLGAIDTRQKSEEGVKVPLLKLDGEPLLNNLGDPVSLTVLGADSRAYRAANRRLQRLRLERAQKNRGKLATDEQLDEAEAEDIAMLASVTTGWEGVLDSKDKPVPFSRDGIVQLYTQYPIAREQAEAATLDRTRFTQPS